MNTSHAATDPVNVDDPLRGYVEDGFGEPETAVPDPDDDPSGPDDFTPPSASKGRSKKS